MDLICADQVEEEVAISTWCELRSVLSFQRGQIFVTMIILLAALLLIALFAGALVLGLGFKIVLLFLGLQHWLGIWPAIVLLALVIFLFVRAVLRNAERWPSKHD